MIQLFNAGGCWFFFRCGVHYYAVCDSWIRDHLELPERFSLWFEVVKKPTKNCFRVSALDIPHILVDDEEYTVGLNLFNEIRLHGPCWVQFWYKEVL